MKKSTIKFISNTTLWFALAIIPLALMVLNNIHNTDLVFSDYLTIFANDNNLFYTMFADMFGSNGYLPLVSNDICIYVSYLCCLTILQIIFNICLFVPKLCVSWLEKINNSLGGGDGTL